MTKPIHKAKDLDARGKPFWRKVLSLALPFPKTLSVPLASQLYVGYYGGGWHFSATPNNANGTNLTLNSTARLIDRNKSYYNNLANYSVPQLAYYGQQFLNRWVNNPGLNQDMAQCPPDARTVDDSGDPTAIEYNEDGTVIINYHDDPPEWMDIYFMETAGTTVGVDPSLVNAFGGNTWRELVNPQDMTIPDDPVRVYK